MDSQKGIKRLFREGDQMYFDFSQAPTLITRKERNNLTKPFKEDASQWDKAQRSFMCWTKDERMFTREYIESGKETFTAFFKERGYLQGNVLDIGGGWGLYRQWWEPGESDVFIVHDPGVERFLSGPHELHHDYYSRAFSFPMTFVEGFGEAPPYKDGLFDTCLIAAALDHCIDPPKVLAEAYRCLKPGGSILVIQRCDSPQSQSHIGRSHILKRLVKYFVHPKRLLSILYKRLFYSDHHLHHFRLTDITSLLERVNPSKIDTYVVPGSKQGIYAFEAQK
jgi:ubiquinone/menaquinone biosynthesis C-methylase UbiE